VPTFKKYYQGSMSRHQESRR